MIDKIKDNLSKAINISELDIVDESPNHGGYDGSVSHVKIIIVSDDFKENRLLDRHKIVYKALGSLVSEIHAISIVAKTKQEWFESNELNNHLRVGRNLEFYFSYSKFKNSMLFILTGLVLGLTEFKL